MQETYYFQNFSTTLSLRLALGAADENPSSRQKRPRPHPRSPHRDGALQCRRSALRDRPRRPGFRASRARRVSDPCSRGSRQRAEKNDPGLRLFRRDSARRRRVRSVLDRGRSETAGQWVWTGAVEVCGERGPATARAYAADRDLVEGKLRSDDSFLSTERV